MSNFSLCYIAKMDKTMMVMETVSKWKVRQESSIKMPKIVHKNST